MLDLDVVDNFKEMAFSRHNTTDLQMNSVYIKKVDKIPAQKRETGHNVTPLIKKLFTNDSCFKRKSQIPSM